MTFRAIIQHRCFLPVAGGLLCALAGLLAWATPPGEFLIHASYDYLFRFGARRVTNDLVVVLMDDDSRARLGLSGGMLWDRGALARLASKMADDGCRLAVFDVYFAQPGAEPEKDRALVAALQRLPCVALMARQHETAFRNAVGVDPHPPAAMFNEAARNNWGVAWLDSGNDLIVRQHWPFPSPGPYPSLPWISAKLGGASLDPAPRGRWMRYYVPDAWTTLRFGYALSTQEGFFRDKIVFIGRKPATTFPGAGDDSFPGPHFRWTGEARPGVEMMATQFLNLLNGESLERAPGWIEALVLVLAGGALGAGLTRRGWKTRLAASAGTVAGALVLGVALSEVTNVWFPWLIVPAAQLSCALVWGVFTRVRPVAPTIVINRPAAPLPETPDYELVEPPIGEGACGRVWLVRNAVGGWQALKAVYRDKFPDDRDPLRLEHRGISSYKPLSDRHPNLLRIDFVSRIKEETYFYYVMELGDPLDPGWDGTRPRYTAGDLAARSARNGGRLPVRECARIGAGVAAALHFLHSQGYTHRDVKPGNILFVRNEPKLADPGLLREMLPPKELTYLGTEGYRPPDWEMTGTVAADIYSLGVVLYVISTGRKPGPPAEMRTTLLGAIGVAARFNEAILTACDAEPGRRYKTAEDFRQALLEFF